MYYIDKKINYIGDFVNDKKTGIGIEYNRYCSSASTFHPIFSKLIHYKYFLLYLYYSFNLNKNYNLMLKFNSFFSIDKIIINSGNI